VGQIIAMFATDHKGGIGDTTHVLSISEVQTLIGELQKVVGGNAKQEASPKTHPTHNPNKPKDNGYWWPNYPNVWMTSSFTPKIND
jgi:hypothetical protein